MRACVNGGESGLPRDKKGVPVLGARQKPFVTEARYAPLLLVTPILL